MNIKKLIDRSLNNWVAKVVCFSLAILLYVFYHISMLDKKAFIVPLQVETDGVLTNSSVIPPFIRVYVRTQSENLATINSSAITAKVSLNNYTSKGVYSVPVMVSVNPEIMLLDPLEISVKPESIFVELDEQVERYIPVEPVLYGQVEHGYEISKLDVTPSNVKVVGPSNIISSVKSIYTTKINVNNASTALSVEAGLDNIYKVVRPKPEGSFKVDVTISPSYSELDFSKKKPNLHNLNEGLIVSDFTSRVSFKLWAQTLVLEKEKFTDSILYVDLSEITAPGEYEVPVIVDVPSNVSVNELSDATVKIVLSEKIEVREESKDDNSSEVSVLPEKDQKVVSEKPAVEKAAGEKVVEKVPAEKVAEKKPVEKLAEKVEENSVVEQAALESPAVETPSEEEVQ